MSESAAARRFCADNIRAQTCSRRNSVSEAARLDSPLRRPPSALLRPLLRADCMRLARVSAYRPSPGLPIAIVADVHDVPEATMRFVACLTMCLMPVLANAAQTGAQAPSAPQAYCVNGGADFYPYTGEPCKSGYQLGSGNCRKTDGRIVAVPREECLAQAGTVEVHFFDDRRLGAPPPAPLPHR